MSKTSRPTYEESKEGCSNFRTEVRDDVSRKLSGRHIVTETPITELDASEIEITCSSLFDLESLVDVRYDHGKNLKKVGPNVNDNTRDAQVNDEDVDAEPDTRRIKRKKKEKGKEKVHFRTSTNAGCPKDTFFVITRLSSFQKIICVLKY